MKPTPSRTREEILDDISSIEVMAKGKITPKTTRDGKPNGYKLQRWHNHKNQSIHVPPEKAELFKAATENYSKFDHLVREYADACEATLLRKPDTEKKKRQPSRPSKL